MIFSNMQVPASMVPSRDWYIAKLLYKRVGQRDGIDKGCIFTKMKQISFVISTNEYFLTHDCPHFAHILFFPSWHKFEMCFWHLPREKKEREKMFQNTHTLKYKVKKRQAT